MPTRLSTLLIALVLVMTGGMTGGIVDGVTSGVCGRLCDVAGGTVLAAGLTEESRLSAVYDDILSARFDTARGRLATACPPAPSEACLTLAVAITWWQIVLDLDSRALDRELETAAATAIAATEAWTRRDPQRAEAWFYHAAAYAPLVQLRVARGQRLAAARDGNRIRVALERALALDPTLHDAKFGIGLYHYYADVAPAAAKMLRFLLLLPGGDRRQGLREMIETRERGHLLRGEADYQLHWLYLWYEDQPARALELLRGLDERYPRNPVFLQRRGEVLDEYIHDHPASAAASQALLTRVAAGTVSAPRIAEVRARLGLAVQLDAMEETDRAIEQLRTVVQLAPTAPAGAHARAQLLLGEALDRIGDREGARSAYRAALATTAAGDDVAAVGARARAGLRRRPDAVRADAYRLSLTGWRALERGDHAGAAATLTRAHALDPENPAIASRAAHALIRVGDAAAAQRALEGVVNSRRDVPAVILAAACVDYASLVERSGDRSQAVALYQRARSIVGSHPHTHDAATEALTRLTK